MHRLALGAARRARACYALAMREPASRAGGPRRIALFTNKMDVGGVQRAFVSLARELVARGHAVELLLARARGEMLAQLPAEVPCATSTVARPTRGARAVRRARRRTPARAQLRRDDAAACGAQPRAARGLPRREAPDALLATPMPCSLVALFAAQLAGSRVRIVAREANTLSQQIAQRRLLYTKHLPALAREWYPRAAGIVAVSDGVADDLARSAGIAREPIATDTNRRAGRAVYRGTGRRERLLESARTHGGTVHRRPVRSA